MKEMPQNFKLFITDYVSLHTNIPVHAKCLNLRAVGIISEKLPQGLWKVYNPWLAFHVNHLPLIEKTTISFKDNYDNAGRGKK